MFGARFVLRAATHRRTAGALALALTATSMTVLVAPASATTPVKGYGVIATTGINTRSNTLAVNSTTHTAYVASTNTTASVTAISGTSFAVTSRSDRFFGAWGIAVDPTSARVLTTESSDNYVDLSDANTLQLITSTSAGSVPLGIAVDPTTATGYAANYRGNTASIFAEGASTSTTLTVGSGPRGVAVNPTTHTAYVSNYFGGTVSVITKSGSAYSVSATIGVGSYPDSIAVDPTTNTVYVANMDTLTIINGATNQVAGTVGLPYNTHALAVDPVARILYSTNYSTATVSVLDLAAGYATAAVVPVGDGAGPVAVAVDTSTHNAFVLNYDNATVAVVGSGPVAAVTAVSPSTGLPSGGRAITITGTDLTGASAVRFGATAASSFSVDSPTQITATAPAESVGAVDVTVTTPYGTSAVTPADGFTYAKATPTLSTSPSPGTAAGGALSEYATLTGGSAPTGTVDLALFGPDDPSCAGPPVSTASVPAGASVDSGDVAVTRAGTYHWTASYSGDGDNTGAPASCGDATVVTAAGLDHLTLSPSSASVVAGGSQDYTAEGFDAYGNDLGDVTAATSFDVDGATCDGASCSPTAAGQHTVTGTDGSASGVATLAVVAAPIDHLVLSPSSASVVAGGSQDYTAEGFDAYGNDLGDVTGETTFALAPVSGGSSAGAGCTGTTCSAATYGSYGVTGTNGAATGTAALEVTPVPVVVSGLSGSAGPATGGTTVTINGTGFTGAEDVRFGTTTAAFTVVSDTRITVATPRHAPGAVDVTVARTPVTSATGSRDVFTFVAAPVVSALTPAAGPTAGGTAVTITGANLTGVTRVLFGSVPARTVSVSATRIVAVAPAHVAGRVYVTVSTRGGTSATSTRVLFAFVAPPSVSSLSSTSGTHAGGQTVTIRGARFTAGSRVSFGATVVAARRVTLVSGSILRVVTPAHVRGTVYVYVSTVGGKSRGVRYTFR